MFNQCTIEHHCNLKNMMRCTYYIKDNNIKEAYKSCIHLFGGIHCVNTNAIKEALKEELEDFNIHG